MKIYSRETRLRRNVDMKLESVVKSTGEIVLGPSDDLAVQAVKDWLGMGVAEKNPELLMSSQEFISSWRKYVEYMALFKEDEKGKSFKRNTEYPAIGIMDENDLLQEAYTTFLESYNKIDWNKVKEVDQRERAPYIWSFLKKTLSLTYQKHLLFMKDGIKVPYRELFPSAYAKEKGVGSIENSNIKNITSLFGSMEKAFANLDDDMSATKYETDLLGFFLEDLMAEHLDRNFKGEVKNDGIERFVLMNIMGIDGAMTYDELSNHFNVSKQSLMSVKKRAIKKLRDPRVMSRIHQFVVEYGIKTSSNADTLGKREKK